MDPNANLIEQEQIIDALVDFVVPLDLQEERALKARLRVLRGSLRQWIQYGGFEPDWTKTPRASKYFGRPIVAA